MSRKRVRSTANQTIYERPAELLQNLIRFDTTNPPGNEAECVAYISSLLTEAGVKTTLLAKDANRPNLIARLKGQGTAAPILLYGHVDVATTVNQKWTHPPFEGKVEDGYIWGRGALDMKGGVAMMLTAFLRAQAEGLNPAGDIVLAILSDEEAFGEYGAKYLVENHAKQFDGIRYAIGEFGGFSIHFGKQKFYLIQVAEKQICWVKATLSGPGGHGSLTMRGGAMAKLGQLLQQLDKHSLPVHITPVTRQIIEAIASTFNTDFDNMLELLAQTPFEPLLQNTLNPTIIHGGEKINVIPSKIVLELDGRLLPGFSPEDIIAELRQIISDEVKLEVIRFDHGPDAKPDMGLFDLLADILRKADPSGKPLPLLLPGVSDARFFSRLGIQTYGFLPMKLPADFNFMQTIHAEDERIPVESVTFGTEAIYEALKRYQE